MPLVRLIPVILIKHGLIVRSERFSVHQAIGNPINTVERYSSWNLDELIVLDISPFDFHDLRRDDTQHRYEGSRMIDLLRQVSRRCFMPLTFGGRIRSLTEIEALLGAGADKVVINSMAVEQPHFIEAAARRFGSQCIAVCIDARRLEHGYEVFGRAGSGATGLSPGAWARRLEALGAGELLVQSIDRDGTAEGYDLDLLREVTAATSLPVIALGGASRAEHFVAAVNEAKCNAVAAANIFHFFEMSYPELKRHCRAAGLPVRPPAVGSRWYPREPSYDHGKRDAILGERLAAAAAGDYRAARAESARLRRPGRWCAHCVYPGLSATPMEFDEHGVCMGCRTARQKAQIAEGEWRRRWDLLRELADRHRSRNGARHDCVIAVSGGKDSYFQTHVIKHELGLNPLLVTYDANNWTEIGYRNMRRMADVFGVDHVVITPSKEVLRKLNRLSFQIMGDMSWHAHIGIYTAPVAEAVRRGIPLVFWGEHGYMDLCGQFSMDDFPEMTYRYRLEHCGRSYEYTYFLGLDGLAERDLMTWRYPSDEELERVGIRGLFLGNYVFWEANRHIELVTSKYGFETSSEPFDRTYRLMSNLDDMHENGAHDYLKYIKFGYGRATDHACKDIRAGVMRRDEAIAVVRKYDHVKPRDLQRWLSYVGMEEEEFDRIADTFRDPRVWRMSNGEWLKDNIWDRP
jgi:imidazoleglycerol phosphate synthase cyclase subunit